MPLRKTERERPALRSRQSGVFDAAVGVGVKLKQTSAVGVKSNSREIRPYGSHIRRDLHQIDYFNYEQATTTSRYLRYETLDTL